MTTLYPFARESQAFSVKAVICIDMVLTTQQETELCSLYGKISKSEIMSRFDIRNAPHIYTILRKHGIPVRSKSDANIWKRKLNIFSEITEEWQAYFLGLLFSDGNLYKNRISISLVEDDFYVVEEICKHLFVKEPHYYHSQRGHNKPQKCMSVSNVEFSNILQETFNLQPRKSLTCPFPRNIPIKFLNHFIRGYFDGDGCIKKRTSCRREVSILGSKEFLLVVSGVLRLEGIQKITVKPKGNIFTLGIYNASDVEKFREFLYKKASIYLIRKWTKFFDF